MRVTGVCVGGGVEGQADPISRQSFLLVSWVTMGDTPG
jgi:hypothetical protein